MGLFSFFSRVYDVDTLDTRFTTSSTTPYKTIIEARNDPVAQREAAAKNESRVQPSKWNTPEFYFYYLVFILAVPYMFWVPYNVSRESDPRYHKYEHLLSEGWVPGRKLDNTENQYRTFRMNLPFLVLLLVLHPVLRRVFESFYKPNGGRKSPSAIRMEQRASFDSIFAVIFMFALHGISALKVLGILYINYQIATKLPRSYIPPATWIFNICTLFANELCNGYPLRWAASFISPPTTIGADLQSMDSALMQWGGWLDSFGGILARWEIMFNITVLRLISFNLDRYWSVEKGHSNSIEKKQLDPANLSERDRVSIPADIQDFSMRNYIAYVLYGPLYFAGPIITFNDYISQIKYRAASIERPRTILYAVRFALVLLAMELMLHFNYVGAISNANPVWSDYSAAELSLLSFMNLHIIWLKLLLPWRLSRLWALVDGIDPPENMTRCPSNNYSTQLFWRAWHRSYNRWLIRYLYVPLGGASFRTWQSAVRSLFTFLGVFTFVALWHDIQLRLLIWGWLVVLFMVPEWTATYFFPKRKWESRPTEYRILCGVGAVGNVLMMISANLVGFALGLDGLETIVKSILHEWSGVIFVVVASSCLFVGVQVMFEIREAEKRKGATLKC